MNYKTLSNYLGIEHVEIEDDIKGELFDNYVPYGGGGAGIKNGHYGCKHTEDNKKIMSSLKKGKSTWNKGVKGYSIHTNKSKQAMSEKLRGSQNGRSLLSEDIVRNIIKSYLSKTELDGVGKIQKNGIPMSYDWLFCKMKSKEYNVTAAAIKQIIQKKNWKNVWSEFEV